MVEFTYLKVPKTVYNRLQRVVDSSGGTFSSVEEYATFVLEEVLKDTEGGRELNPKEEAEVQERLKKLGYV